MPLLNDAGGGGDDAASIASAMGLLSDALTGENNSGSGSSSSSGSGGGTGGSGTGGSGSGDNGSDPFVQDSDSWEKGVAVPSDPEEEGHSVESGLRSAGGAGDVEEVDQVDVIMQVRRRFQKSRWLIGCRWRGAAYNDRVLRLQYRRCSMHRVPVAPPEVRPTGVLSLSKERSGGLV